jgi:hypothetical protein
MGIYVEVLGRAKAIPSEMLKATVDPSRQVPRAGTSGRDHVALERYSKTPVLRCARMSACGLQIGPWRRRAVMTISGTLEKV